MTYDIAEDFLADPEDGQHETIPAETLIPPDRSLGRHLLRAAMTTAQFRRFRHSPGLCVVIEAPTPAWVAPLRAAANALADWQRTEGRDGTTRHARKPQEGEDEFARLLAAGLRVVAVSHAPQRFLPPSLVAGADMRIRVGHPTPAVIRKAIRDATGSKPRAASEKLGVGLDFFDLISAIRVGSDVRTCIRRLEAASVSLSVVSRFGSDVPDLHILSGYDDAMAWSSRLVEDVEAWRRGDIADFSTIDRQVVFAGPPGTGKTTLVTSIAKATNLPLITTSVARWFIDGSSYIDGVLKQAEAVFAKASDAAPAILFLDECDAIPNRATVGSRNADYWAPIVGFILQFLDGVSSSGPSSANLVIIGATNFPDSLDPALVRPGRLSRIIRIKPPDESAIPGILRQHLGADLADTDLTGIAGLAAGATGAVLAGWVKSARRQARVAKRPMTIADLRAEILAPDTRSPGSLWRCAVHEISHALVAHLEGAGEIKSVSILTDGAHGGSMVASYPRGEVTRTRGDIERLITTALAGRAGEMVFGLEASTGAHSDLEFATNMAAAVHASYGMGESLAQRRHADKAASLIDEDAQFRRLVEVSLKASAARAAEIVSRHRGLIETLATALVEMRRIDGVDFRRRVEAYGRNHTDLTRVNDGGSCHG
ncbi:hypothetical protein ASG63_14105 [Methylobacterium sp. Leaf94]|uniref:AAA family ATPase n=1 Tax=Methylobacterium sp. Leaf94 TaxID=1736250 RepID=UPI0006FB6D88|nr:AAA family ATPase [Methylobacterium sp. Leaf94]KQU34156.1 hypothetical protein ASG63_14105 [Methylobacterium sp. Leaf94]